MGFIKIFGPAIAGLVIGFVIGRFSWFKMMPWESPSIQSVAWKEGHIIAVIRTGIALPANGWNRPVNRYLTTGEIIKLSNELGFCVWNDAPAGADNAEQSEAINHPSPNRKKGM